MKTKLTDKQKQLIDNLIENTILPALTDNGICEPDMSDIEEEFPATYDETYSERVDILMNEALIYLKNNLH